MASNERTIQLLNSIEIRLLQLQKSLKELFFSLDLQEKVSCQETLNKFASLASEFLALQIAIRKLDEDNNNFLKSHVLVPQQISFIPDADLEKFSKGRITTFNHELVPILLRTKLTPEVEDEVKKIEQDTISRPTDQLLKQINNYNKNIDLMLIHLETTARQTKERYLEMDKRNYSNENTTILVKAIMRGIAIKPKPDIASLAAQNSTSSAAQKKV